MGVRIWAAVFAALGSLATGPLVRPAKAQSPTEVASTDTGERDPSNTPAPRRYHMTLYGATWGEFNLPSLPQRVVTLDVPTRPTYFVSLGGAYAIVPDVRLPLGLFALEHCAFELDAQLLKHFGKQSHIEVSGAIVFRTGTATIANALNVNFAVGEGLSVAMRRPRYEKGPDGRRGEGSRRFQNHLLFELEFGNPRWPFLHLVLRLHHRSGIYGIISPQKTGSNYLGLGLRMDN